MRAWTLRGALALLLFSAGVAQADNPLVFKDDNARRAELNRGFVDGFQCYLYHQGNGVETCFVQTANRNRQKLHAGDPLYELGVFFSAVFTYSSDLQSDEDNAAKDQNSRILIPFEKKVLADMYMDFRTAQRLSGWTDEQLVAAMNGMKDPAKKKMLVTLKKWEASPPVFTGK